MSLLHTCAPQPDLTGLPVVAQPLAFALEEGELERVIEQCTTEKKQRPQKDRSITVVVKESVATVLLAALRSLTTVNCGDRSQVALLAQTLNQIREPNFLALCLHELDNRDLLETTLHVLPFAFPDSHGLHLLFNRLLDMVRPFRGVYHQMTTLLPSSARQCNVSCASTARPTQP